jgi:hypothetical protein
VYPCRGQTVKVDFPKLDYFLICPDDDFLAYCFPRCTDVLLGGTHQDHNASQQVCEQDSRDIVERCARLIPEVRNSEFNVFESLSLISSSSFSPNHLNSDVYGCSVGHCSSQVGVMRSASGPSRSLSSSRSLWSHWNRHQEDSPSDS